MAGSFGVISIVNTILLLASLYIVFAFVFSQSFFPVRAASKRANSLPLADFKSFMLLSKCTVIVITLKPSFRNKMLEAIAKPALAVFLILGLPNVNQLLSAESNFAPS